jgi:hypothetical protein
MKRWCARVVPALLFLVNACGSSARSGPSPTPSSAGGLRSLARDTTVRVEQGELELFLRLSPVPRRIGETVALERGVRNIGDAAREIIVSPCHLFSRGIDAYPEVECQMGSGPVTLESGESWSSHTYPRFEGTPGRHRFEVQAVVEPPAWVGLDLELAR